MRIPFKADAGVGAALGRLGRTEDVRLSPSGRRLAVAGYMTNRLLIVDVAIDIRGDQPRVELSRALEVSSPSFNHPHGVSWLDEHTLIVASRYAEVGIFELPDASGHVALDPVRRIGEDRRDLVKYPGSVSAFPVGLGLVELLVCNNHVHHVSRHLVDGRDACTVLASECLVSAGLQLPDGVAHSRSGRWIAVSNHDAHNVFVYRYDETLHDTSVPNGVLHDVGYPHGLVFSADERWILVADADTPLVRVFHSPDATWDGDRESVSSIQIVSDANFERGRFLPGEGGPKGIELTADGALLLATCEEDPLAFFDMRATLGTIAVDTDPAARAARLDEAERARLFLLRYLGAARSRVDEATAAIRRTSEQEVALLLTSRWWRITAPFRELTTTLRYAALRARHRLNRV